MSINLLSNNPLLVSLTTSQGILQVPGKLKRAPKPPPPGVILVQGLTPGRIQEVFHRAAIGVGDPFDGTEVVGVKAGKY